VSAYPKPASGAPSFPELEIEVLDYWERDGTFRATTLLAKCASRYENAPEKGGDKYKSTPGYRAAAAAEKRA